MAKKKLLISRQNSLRSNKTCRSRKQNGYELETDSLGGNPVLRRLKNNEEIHPLSTIKALEQRGTARTNQPWQRSRPAHYRVAFERK
jgi:hypothetical protein